jgi:hypothetical protein
MHLNTLKTLLHKGKYNTSNQAKHHYQLSAGQPVLIDALEVLDG